MEFIATSQPSQDGDLCTLELPTFQSVEDAGVGQIEDGTVDESDSVGSSQPFEDGEEDLLFFTRGGMTPAPTACWSFLTTPELSDAEPSETDADLDDAIRARQSRRARLIRRAPPVSPVKPSPIPACPWPQSLSLVRRVTMEAVSIRKPWPAASASGDPGAADDELEELLDDSWNKALELLDLDNSDDDLEPRTMRESNLIQAHIPQLRGAIMTIADALVVIYYKFIDPHTLEDPTPEKIAAAKDANCQLVQDLQGTYMYRDYRNTIVIADICRHPIFQQLLNKAFFAKSGAREARSAERLGVPGDARMRI
ncbi:hypothetical protein DFH09DRAFT_1440242 [Mycena vulgaris]|nr:hypothetical protein DFH09DRAFT_1440242 [Mycena vulgaris]